MSPTTLIASIVAFSGPAYELTELGSLFGSHTHVFDMNENGCFDKKTGKQKDRTVTLPDAWMVNEAKHYLVGFGKPAEWYYQVWGTEPVQLNRQLMATIGFGDMHKGLQLARKSLKEFFDCVPSAAAIQARAKEARAKERSKVAAHQAKRQKRIEREKERQERVRQDLAANIQGQSPVVGGGMGGLNLAALLTGAGAQTRGSDPLLDVAARLGETHGSD